LTTRKLNATGSDEGFITIREKLLVLDEFVNRGLLASFVEHKKDFFVVLVFSISLFDTVQNVVPDGILEKNGLLLDNSDLTVIPFTVDLSDVTTVEFDSTGAREVELLQHGNATGLSTPTSSDKGNHFLVMVVDFETNVIESHNIHLLRVREFDVFKGEVTGNGIVIEENITTDVHDFRLVLHDLLEGIVHSSNS
jgi:hypothetical protein